MATGIMQAAATSIADKNKINPFTQEFDESKGVAGRTDALINQNSALMQTAATTGAQTAAKRGLLNSSTGVQAGQQAVINTAAPIAQADASLYSQNSLANLAAKNQAATANAQMASTLEGQGLGLDNSNMQQDKSLTESGRQADQNLAMQNKQLDAQIAQFAQQLGLSVQELALKRDTLTENQKQALDNLNFQKSQLAQNQSQFTSSQAQTQAQFTSQMAARQKELDAQISQFAQSLGMSVQDLALRRDQLSSANKQALDTLNLQKSQLAQNQAQFTTQQANNQSNFQSELAQKATLASLDTASREKIATMQLANQADIQNSATVANAWGTMMTSIGAIQNNSALEQGAKATLIQNTIDSFQSYASFWKKLDGGKTDITDLMNFGVVTTPSGSAAPPPVYVPQPGNPNGQPGTPNGEPGSFYDYSD